MRYTLQADKWSTGQIADGGDRQSRALARAARLACQEQSAVVVYNDSTCLVAIIAPNGYIEPCAGYKS